MLAGAKPPISGQGEGAGVGSLERGSQPSPHQLAGWGHRCKKRFYVFLFWSRFLHFFSFFIFQTFLFLKNVGKVQSGKQINKKHFQNNCNEIQWVHK